MDGIQSAGCRITAEFGGKHEPKIAFNPIFVCEAGCWWKIVLLMFDQEHRQIQYTMNRRNIRRLRRLDVVIAELKKKIINNNSMSARINDRYRCWRAFCMPIQSSAQRVRIVLLQTRRSPTYLVWVTRMERTKCSCAKSNESIFMFAFCN